MTGGDARENRPQLQLTALNDGWDSSDIGGGGGGREQTLILHSFVSLSVSRAGLRLSDGGASPLCR